MPQEKTAKRKPHGVLFFFAAFVIIVAVTFIFRKSSSITWTEDYQAGVQRSAKLNKPALVCFYFKGGTFTSAMRQGTWRDPKVVAFVDKTFVPILVSLDDNPDIAKGYGAGYDGACFIRLPDGTQSDQATHGNRPAEEYIQKLQAKLTEVASKKP
jgi:hypothetical protein